MPDDEMPDAAKSQQYCWNEACNLKGKPQEVYTSAQAFGNKCDSCLLLLHEQATPPAHGTRNRRSSTF